MIAILSKFLDCESEEIKVTCELGVRKIETYEALKKFLFCYFVYILIIFLFYAVSMVVNFRKRKSQLLPLIQMK